MRDLNQNSAKYIYFCKKCDIIHTESFYGKLQPQIITVSAGASNSYGHPGEEALTRMENSGAKIYVTINSGQITVGKDAKGIWLREYRREGLKGYAILPGCAGT